MARNRKRPKQPYVPKDLPTKFNITYGADFLERVGPYVPAFWTVPELVRTQLMEAGRPVPDPVKGHMLLDTGADNTCISQQTAEHLALRPVRRVDTYGVGGLHKNDVVAARLHMRIGNKRGVNTMSWDLECQAVPELEQHAERYGIIFRGEPVRLIGLIGRDILRRATVTYSGKSGKLEIAFDRQWVKKLQPLT